MTQRFICPGLRAGSLNGWLAALGATALVPGLKLAWSEDPEPIAVLEHGSTDPAEAIAECWPTTDEIDDWSMARHLPGMPELTLRPDVDAWTPRAGHARTSPKHWTLSSLYTDLAWSSKERQFVIERGQFLTPMPGVSNTMWDRLQRIVAEPSTTEHVSRSLCGEGRRVNANGIGLDLTRIGSQSDTTDMYVDPIIEVLVFFGLSFFPTRAALNGHVDQRGWTAGPSTVGAFGWLSWRQSLDAAAIDALLDRDVAAPLMRDLLDITGRWEIVPFRGLSSSDSTRGYGSRLVE